MIAVSLIAAFLVALAAAVASRGWADSRNVAGLTTTNAADPSTDYWHKRFQLMKRYARKQEIEKGHWIKRTHYLERRLASLVGGATYGSGFSSAQASWYGPGFYGQRTACGQTLTTASNWVAHKSLACGTQLIVCVARCSRTSVQDRGPYVAGREFDLAPGLKAAIGFGSTGTVRWKFA